MIASTPALPARAPLRAAAGRVPLARPVRGQCRPTAEPERVRVGGGEYRECGRSEWDVGRRRHRSAERMGRLRKRFPRRRRFRSSVQAARLRSRAKHHITRSSRRRGRRSTDVRDGRCGRCSRRGCASRPVGCDAGCRSDRPVTWAVSGTDGQCCTRGKSVFRIAPNRFARTDDSSSARALAPSHRHASTRVLHPATACHKLRHRTQDNLGE
jgi:hypothetical protein